MAGKNKKLAAWRVSERRRAIKKQAVEYKGGKCCRCGYNKSISALDFHHSDPTQKDFGIASKGCSRSWERVKQELDKCIMVCKNCHAELHDELRAKQLEQIKRSVPEAKARESRKIKIKCGYCNTELITYPSRVKKSSVLFCGRECKRRFFQHPNWPDDEELGHMVGELGLKKTVAELGTRGISKSAVYDRLRKMRFKDIPG